MKRVLFVVDTQEESAVLGISTNVLLGNR
jgi:hypothetical protein